MTKAPQKIMVMALALMAMACSAPRPVVLLIGQSNAGGGNTATPTTIPEYGQIFDLETKSWVAYRPGVSDQYSGGTFGPELGIKAAMDGVSVIKVAVGDTAFERREGVDRPIWDPKVRGELFDRVVSAIEESSLIWRSEVIAVVWVHGEADSLSKDAAGRYQANQAAFFEAITDVVGNVPWYVSKPRRGSVIDRPGIDTVRAAIDANAEEFGYRTFDLESYTSTDLTHLDDMGCIQFGLDVGKTIEKEAGQ